MEFVSGFLAVVLTVGAWTLICNERTYRKRGELIDVIHSPNKGPTIDMETYNNITENSRMLWQASYDEHFFALVLFRDWRSVYPTLLRERFPEVFK